MRSSRLTDRGETSWEKIKLDYSREYLLELEPTDAEVLIRDAENRPLMGRHSYGKGEVWFLNMPLEANLLTAPEGFANDAWKIWAAIGRKLRDCHDPEKENPYVGMTIHKTAGTGFAVLVNYSNKTQKTGFRSKKNYQTVLGKAEELPPFGTAIVEYSL